MPTTNRELPWDALDPESYATYNYWPLRADDRQILAAVRDHFSGMIAGRAIRTLRGIDVGSGSNLYPALAMLPWCSRITLLEHGKRNVDWLQREVGQFSENWDEYWHVLSEHPAYRSVTDPRGRLARIARVVGGNLFSDLPVDSAEIGTMFFVAESVSGDRGEFSAALDRFTAALMPGAPFAVAFMENSLGYDVGDLRFPACAIGPDDVFAALSSQAASDLGVIRIEPPGAGPLRTGYTGMLLALGRKRVRGADPAERSTPSDPEAVPSLQLPGRRPAP
ncbi:SCO2525 family SAM-dependent methyltransferase [Kitasatospora sp. CM 4170]|uniref:SCO2525 family SAM-dependent methyltransferase n=1 Tax=Kitasatospora aburaviensis TaxID=67265 RepID=A0ABW1F694_9ACTN|nr:SCO2525 family SAM-dependent methyltransferase [Kitasatospora sp. CM 4170]WNM49063.1 SCO2525 family SAM-dependent methyltransferase [Kitasatospora sp. CM 4170]